MDSGDLSGEGWRVMVGSCLDRLRELPDASVDAVVTDPPYELGFMGKSWDSSGIAFSTDVWLECLRVFKPGGHLLAFGGSRTWHRIAVAVEDAGFQIRDSVAWLYGSGFPKSLDVSKAIDKSTGENRARQLRFTEWMRSTGVTVQEVNEATGTQMGSHYLSSASQPAIATADLFDKLRHLLPDVPEEIERLVAERTGIEWTAYKNREVVRSKTFMRTTQSWESSGGMLSIGEKEVKETLPATDEAVKWQGWGTALKPAFEPVIVARKPLVGTVAANVLEFGTGALNIDATRIGTESIERGRAGRKTHGGGIFGSSLFPQGFDPAEGRWPSNVVLDEFTAGLVDEQSGVSVSKAANRGLQVSGQKGGLAGELPNYKEGTDTLRGHSDSGGASRFFYVAKASKRDRNEGLDALQDKSRPTMGNGIGDQPNQQIANNKNFHPTVKPTDLMRQLVRLVTPPGGVVLDPFTGSGSTGKAAILEGFEFIGCELTEEYLPIIQGRLNHAVATVKAEQDREEEKLF